MNFEPKKFLLVLFFGMLMFPAASAQVITAEGVYVMLDEIESPATAKERARQSAKQAALEQVNVHVESVSKTLNGKITEDLVRAVARGLLRVIKSDVTIESADDGNLLFRCKLSALIDDEKITHQLSQPNVDSEKLVRRNAALENQINKVTADLNALKNSASRRELQEKILVNEKHFQAIELLASGNTFMLEKNFQRAAENYERALKILGDNADVFYCLADAYFELKNYSKAEHYYAKAAQLDSTSAG